MSNNERLPPKSSARGTSRRTGMNAIPTNTAQDQNVRDTQYYAKYAGDEDHLLIEDDPYASNPPRSPSSAIRLNKPSPSVRKGTRDVSTEPQTRRTGQPNYVPARRTQKQEPGQFSPTSARPARSTTTYDIFPAKKEPRNMHWLLYVGMGMIILLALWVIGVAALAWGTNQYNNLVYGYPRTFQIDMAVGHNDSPANPSHFIALNLRGQVIIIELPGGDPSKAIDYTGPDLVGPGDDQIPITLSFSDFYHHGRLDMTVHIADRTVVFYNKASCFTTTAQSSCPSPASTSQQTPG